MRELPDHSPALAVAFLLLVGALLAAVRLTGLPDLMDNEQQRQAAYIMDAQQNGDLLCQRDNVGEITSKPPMYTWLATITSLPFARINRLAITLPAVLATIATALLIFFMGRKPFGDAGAFWGGVIYLCCAPTAKQIGLARMDALMPLFVALGAWAAWNIRTSGRGWILFFLAVAASMLTKGPHGPVLAAMGLLSVFWEKRGSRGFTMRWGWFAVGLLIFLGICVGWFCLSIMQMGPAVYHKLILEEFVEQAVQKHSGQWPLSHFYVPPLQVLVRWAPWSLLLIIGVWRVIARPAENTTERRFERFAFCWFFGGLLMFGIPSHERADFLWPIYPAAALLAGREVVMLLRNLPLRWLPRTTVALALLIASATLALATMQYHVWDASSPDVIHTVAVRDFCHRISGQVGDDFPLTNVDDPFAVNFYFNTMRPLAYGPTKSKTGFYDAPLNATYDYEHAARLLKSDCAAFVLIGQLDELAKYYSNPAITLHELDAPRYPHLQERHNDVRLLSNRPELKYYDKMIAGIGPLVIETHNIRWQHASQNDLRFSGEGFLKITNQGTETITIRVQRNGRDEFPVIAAGRSQSWGTP